MPEETDKTQLSRVEIHNGIMSVNDTMRDLLFRMDSVENRMGTISAHMENIARESAKTTDVLERGLQYRKDKEEYEREVAIRKLDRVDQIEDNKQARVAKISFEVWSLFKKPLAYVITGIFAWLLYTYFGVSA